MLSVQLFPPAICSTEWSWSPYRIRGEKFKLKANIKVTATKSMNWNKGKGKCNDILKIK